MAGSPAWDASCGRRPEPRCSRNITLLRIKPTYACDEDAMMCKLQNATGGMTNKTQCDAGCPATPLHAAIACAAP